MRAPLAVWLAAAALALGCAGPVAGPAEATSALSVRARAVEIAPAALHGLSLLGSVVLSSEHPEFGGFSGLLIEDGALLAVTDAGWLLSAELQDGLRPGPASFAPLPGDSGRGGKSSSDAESLARQDGGLVIGFERDHRIEVYDDGRVVAELRDRRFERLSGNSGFEALAALPDGRLLAIAEIARQGAFPAYVIGPDGAVTAGGLAQTGPHEVTGADVGPDGRLYLLRRNWSLFRGFSVRVERYWLGEDGFPRPETREVLARLDSIGGVDNMEGIALWRDAQGRTRLTLISDDNFNLVQRTLLMDLVVE